MLTQRMKQPIQDAELRARVNGVLRVGMHVHQGTGQHAQLKFRIALNE